jgi:prepilin-type N-terminal cleavage/methylation domain-containing protein
METKQGFTLIELILVIALLGVLIGMAVPLMRHSFDRLEVENRAATLDPASMPAARKHYSKSVPSLSKQLGIVS